jgi:cytochrome c553
MAAAISLTTPAGLAAGNAAAGGTKFEACLGCHAVPNYSNVYPRYRVPKLAGQRPEYIVEALKSYQSGQRAHATMRANATTLTEQDMDDIAAFLIAAQ